MELTLHSYAATEQTLQSCSGMKQVLHLNKRKRRAVSAEDCLLDACAEVLHVSPEDIHTDSSFLSYGGHSISAIALSAKFKQQGIQIPADVILMSSSIAELLDMGTKTAGPTNRSLKRSKGSHNGSQRARICDSAFNFEKAVCTSEYAGSSNAPDARLGQESIQLTEMQHTLLHGSHQSPGTNIIQFVETFDSCHITALKAAWQRALELEPIFRGRPTLTTAGEATLIHEARQFDWNDVVCTTPSELQAVLREIPEDASISTKFRAVTLKASSDRDLTTIIWNVNHALIDGYSAMMLYGKVRRAAEGAAIYPGTPFAKVARDIEYFRQHRSVLHKRFWRQKKIDHPHAKGDIGLALSPQETNAPKQSSISLQCTGDLQSWCSSHNVTLASLHYSVWALVLSTYVDSNTVVFGTVLSGRNLDIPGVEDTIGPLVNTLPFYATIDESRSCENFVHGIFTQLLEWNEVQTSVTSDGFSRDFDSSIAMEIDKPTFDGLKIQGVEPSFFDLQSDIPLNITFTTSGLVSFRFASHRMSNADAEMVSKLYEEWLIALTTSSDTIGACLHDISRRCYASSLLRAGHLDLASTFHASIQDDLIMLFEKTVNLYSNHTAIKMKDHTISYAELDDRAGHVAACLSDFVRPQDVVCVHADRSINWIITIYAILKLGAIYAPLDPALPACSKTANYRIANAVLYLTPSSEPTGPLPEGARILSVEEFLHDTTLRPFPRHVNAQPDAAAYVCFTSGSTGKPKAVLCRHRGLVAFQRSETVRLFARPGLRIAQIMSPAFDGSIHEIFSALSYGATLVLPESKIGMQHLADSDSAILTPSVANVLSPEDYPRLQHVYFVGEPVPQNVCDLWASSKQLFNMYGPTESTCGATIKELHPGDPVTIGKPNPSSRIYILDRHQRPCPPNIVGDIYTAGIQVAAGYMGNSVQTSARFLSDKFRPASGELMYWTGDRGCWTHGGEVRCLGRSDRQIKLNGFRLDLNMLEEQILEEIPEISAIGLVKKLDFLQVAVAPSSLDSSQLKAEIAGRLPVYALPRYIFPVDDLPKTSVGKIDYRAIEAWAPSTESAKSSTEFTETEEKVKSVWQDVFKVGKQSSLSPHSAIIDFGGDSLTLVACANRLSAVFGRSVRLQQVIEARTLRDLALAIEQIPERRSEERSPSPQADGVTVSEAEWFEKYELASGTTSFNVSVAWEFDPDLFDPNRLAEAWNTVLEGHQILRSFYQKHPTQGIQKVYHDSPPTVRLVEGIALSEALNKPFQLERDHLIRVFISHNWMAVIISHIICDLTTLRNLLESVASIYSKKACLTKAVTESRRSLGGDQDHPDDLEYWRNTLSAAPKLATWKPVPPRRSFDGTSCASWLPTQLLASLTTFSAKHRVTLHQLALAAVSLALQHDEDSTDIVLGAPFRNRQTAQMSEIGLFLEPLPIRVQHDHAKGGNSVLSFLNSVRHASQAALSHRIPWSRLLQLLDASVDPPQNPFFDVMVTFHDHREDVLLPMSGMKQLHTWSEGAKFKLMVELSAYSDEQLLLRIEYDTECFNQREIDQISGLIGQALRRLTEDTTTSELCEHLSRARTADVSQRYETVTVGSLVESP